MLASVNQPARAFSVIAPHNLPHPVGAVADHGGDLGHVVALGDEPDELPMRAFDRIVRLAVADRELLHGQLRGDGGIAGHDPPS